MFDAGTPADNTGLTSVVVPNRKMKSLVTALTVVALGLLSERRVRRKLATHALGRGLSRWH
jgi:hypothetical protein